MITNEALERVRGWFTGRLPADWSVAPADVTVLRLHRGTFGFIDVRGGRKDGTQKLEAELTVREGRVVWDLNGISNVNWRDLPGGRTP